MILFYQLTTAVTITIITSNTTGNKSIQPIQSRRNKGVVNGTIIGNPDPVRDDCSPSFLPPSGMISVVGKNIGNLLNSKNIRGAGSQQVSNHPLKLQKVNGYVHLQTILVLVVLIHMITILMQTHSNTTTLQPIPIIFLQPLYEQPDVNCL